MAKKKTSKRPFIKKPADLQSLVALGVFGLGVIYVLSVLIYAAFVPGDISWAEALKDGSTWIFQ